MPGSTLKAVSRALVTCGVSGTLFGSWTLVYDDESRLASITYPSGGGSLTDLYWYNALGQRTRDWPDGFFPTRYLYHGDRVLQEYNDAVTWMKRRNNYTGGSYNDLWLDTWRSGYGYRFPLYDLTGTARALVDDTETLMDTYSMDVFGVQLAAPSGSTPNPYRYGAAWGYNTDPSGLSQLGARYYWPEIGRFIQQDPIGDGVNWYAYVGSNPVVWVDPEGLHETESFWHNVFDPGVGGRQFGMSAKATASGVLTGLTGGVYRPDWRDPCDQYGNFSRNMGIGSGAALTTAGILYASGYNPWLGRLARDAKPHGDMGTHLQLDVRTGAHRTTTIFRLPWR